MKIQLNEETGVRVTGYPASPSYYDKTRLDPPCVVFEIGASCGARGSYGIHLTPDQALDLADMLREQSARATGGES